MGYYCDPLSILNDTLNRFDFEFTSTQFDEYAGIRPEDILYYDTSEFKMYFTEVGYEKINLLKAGTLPRPITFAVDSVVVFGGWLILESSSRRCNCIACVPSSHDRTLSFRLGYFDHFKYDIDDFIDPRLNPVLLRFFEDKLR